MVRTKVNDALALYRLLQYIGITVTELFTNVHQSRRSLFIESKQIGERDALPMDHSEYLNESFKFEMRHVRFEKECFHFLLNLVPQTARATLEFLQE